MQRKKKKKYIYIVTFLEPKSVHLETQSRVSYRESLGNLVILHEQACDADILGILWGYFPVYSKGESILADKIRGYLYNRCCTT